MVVESYAVNVRASFFEKLLMILFRPLALWEDIRYEKVNQSFNYFTNLLWVVVIMYVMSTQQYKLDATIVNILVLIALLFVKSIFSLLLFTGLAHGILRILGGVGTAAQTFQAVIYGTTPLLLGATLAEGALLLRETLGVLTVPLALLTIVVAAAFSLHRQYILLAAYHYKEEQKIFFTGMQRQKFFFGLLVSVMLFLIVGSTVGNIIDQNLTIFKKSGRSIATAVCDTTGAYSEICYFSFARNDKDEELCTKAGYEADDCFYTLARDKKDETICLSIQTSSKDFCIEEIAVVKNNHTICPKAASRSGSCYSTIARILQDANLCAYAAEERENCFYDLAKDTLDEKLCSESGIKRERCVAEIETLKKFSQ